MKKYILIVSLFITSIATSLYANETNEIFSLMERKEILRSIDNVCGDTWCEGDYNFKFKNFSCNKLTKSCYVSFHFIKSDEQSLETYSPIQICHFNNITSIKQVQESKMELNEHFYEELTSCIENLESKVEF